jgi:hypothetical protein
MKITRFDKIKKFGPGGKVNSIVDPVALPNINVYGARDKSTDAQMNSISGKNYPDRFNIPDYESMWSSWADNGRPKIIPLINGANMAAGAGGSGKGRAYYMPQDNEMFIRSGVTKDYMAELAHANQIKSGTFKNDWIKYPTYSDKVYDDPTTGEYNAHSVIEPQLKSKYNVKYTMGGQISSKDMTANNYANTIQQTQKSVAGMIPGANIISPVAGAVSDFIDPKDEYGVGKDWASGVRGALDPSMSLSRVTGDIGAGKFDWNTAADLAFPIVGEIMNNKDNKNAKRLATMPQQRMTLPGYQATFPMGGMTPGNVPVELEKEEVFQTPNGMMGKVDGPSHARGGVDMNLPPETFVWSDKLKSSSGRTFAQEADYLAKQKSKYEKILTNGK